MLEDFDALHFHLGRAVSGGRSLESFDPNSMFTRRKLWLVLFSLLCTAFVLLVLFLSIRNKPALNDNAAVISFLGYTNAVNSNRPFALFTISNRTAYAIRWRNDWIEVEGQANHKSRIMNKALPYKREPVLKAGGAFLIAVGEPNDLFGEAKWRLSMTCARDTFGERWLNLSGRHRLPLRVGPLVLADFQKIYDKSNNVTISSIWLGKHANLTNNQETE